MPRQERQHSATGICHVMLTRGQTPCEHQTAVPNISVPIGSTRELSPYEIQYTDYTNYLLGGCLTLRNGRIDKYQFEEGYCQAERYVYDASQDEFTFCYYDRDHLGNIRQVTEADGTSTGNVIQTMNYYPFGAEFCDGSANSSVQSHKYNGKEFDGMHGLNTYDYGARQYNPVTAHWDRVDPLAEKYYSLSPYNYCGNNPVKWVDLRGDSISSTGIAQYGEVINVNILQSVISDWQTISGLTLFISDNGNIEYAKDENGMPIVSVSQKDGETIENGSQAARNLLIKTINAKETITFQGGKTTSNVSGTNKIGINFKQVSAFINGTSKGLDNRTMGWGMTLLHEILHTPINGNLKDDKSSEYSTGPVVDYMNEIRKEMNNQGFNFGIREQYLAIPYGNKFRIHFSGGQYVEF